MNTWAELIDQVMLGTQGAASPSSEWASHTPEQALLKQIALAGAARRGGYVSPAVRSLPELNPAPPEVLPACSIIAVDWLRKMERTTYARELIRDWGIFMIGRRKRVPHTALPAVLGIINKHEQWIPYLLPVIGERGRWLIENSEGYAELRKPELWSGEEKSALKAAEIAEDNKLLIDLRKQMMEGLAHE